MSSRFHTPAIFAVILALVMAGCLGSGDVDGQEGLEPAPTDGDPPDSTDNGRDTTVQSPPGGGGPQNPSVGPSTSNQTGGANDTSTQNLTTYPWGPQAQATVRPGVQVTVGGSVCTSNFLYRSPLNGTYYLGIAAHCVYDTVGEEAFLSNTAGVLGSQGPRIGRTVYSSYLELGVSQTASPQHTENNDLALIQIDEGMLPKTHPSMKHFGGPIGNVTSLSDVSIGEKVLVHGDTSMRPGPDELDRLEGYVTNTDAPWSVYAYLVPYGFQGDSGSAVITADGNALGVLVSLAAVPPGQIGISFLPPMLAFAADRGFPVEVVTWEQFDRGMLPG